MGHSYELDTGPNTSHRQGGIRPIGGSGLSAVPPKSRASGRFVAGIQVSR